MHSAFDVGFERAKMMGRALMAAISLMISSVKAPGAVDAPVFTSSSSSSLTDERPGTHGLDHFEETLRVGHLLRELLVSARVGGGGKTSLSESFLLCVRRPSTSSMKIFSQASACESPSASI